jgi:hypothetical protein
VPVLADAGSRRVDFDVDAACLLNDGLEVVVDRCRIQGVDHICVGSPTCSRDLLRGEIDRRGRAAGEEHVCAFGRELLGDGCADGTSATEHDRVPVLQHS